MKTIDLACGSVTENIVLEKILSKAISMINVEKLMQYEQPLGMSDLREEIVKLHKEKVDKQNIMITSSAQQALSLILACLKKEQHPLLLIQEPAYFGIIRLAKDVGIPVKTFKKVDEIFRGEKVLRNSIIYLTSNYHNPTGLSLKSVDKKKLSFFAEKYNLVIIEDNPHDFIYFGKKQPSKIFSLYPKKTFYVNGFSKILAPGLRVGYVIADQELIQVLKSQKINQDIFTSTIGQQICLIALQNKEYLDDLRFYFKNKRDLAVKLLKKYFKGTEVKWINPKGGIFILLNFPPTVKVKNIIKVARENHNLILENDQFTYLDGISRNQIRINFVKNNNLVLAEGILKLYQSFKEV